MAPPRQIPATNTTPPPTKSLRRNRNDQKWEVHKSEINQLYIEENNTLTETMRVIEQRHGFRASLRKWKDKTRNEWRLEKNFASKDMQVLLAKAEKRARDEGKETVFFHAGSQINPERLENFKKRKIKNEGDILPSADTPENFAYDTPRPEQDSDVDVNEQSLSGRDMSTSSTGVDQESMDEEESVVDLKGVDSQIDDEDWVNLTSEDETSQVSLPVSASATSPSTQTPELLVSPQATDISSSQSPKEPQSVSLQQLNINYTPLLEVQPMAALAEEARINSVIWKGTRRIAEVSTAKTPEAELEYSPTTNSPTSGRTIRCLALQNLTRVAESHKQQGRLAEAASAYRKVIAGYEKAGGDFAGPILTICRSLAIVLKAQGEFEQAEAVLIYAFSLCLDKAQTDPPPAISPAIVLGRPLPMHISYMTYIVTFLEEIYSDQSDSEMKLSLAELRKALWLWNGGPLHFNYPHIWFAITRLASSYSAKGRPASAELLFSEAISNLKAFDDILYGTKKSNAYLGYSLHLQRKQLWERSARMMMLALENVTQMGDQGMVPRDDFEPLIGLVYSRWDGLLRELKERNLDEELVKPMKDLIESKRAQLDHQQQSLDVAVNEMSGLEISRGNSWRNSWRRLPTLTEVSEKDGVSSMSSKSYRYGVTYSGSSITGVSDSVFMVP